MAALVLSCGALAPTGALAQATEGTIGPVAPAVAAPAGVPARGVAPAAAPVAPAAAAQPANLTNGETLYRQACVACHGDAGAGGAGGGASLKAGQSADTILSVMTSGRNAMPAFADTFTAAQRRDIAAYVTEVLQKR